MSSSKGTWNEDTERLSPINGNLASDNQATSRTVNQSQVLVDHAESYEGESSAKLLLERLSVCVAGCL